MRLKGYDYTQPGAYFLTLVTYQREELFGNIVNDEMQLSPLGQIAHDEWMRSIGLRREIRLNMDEFIVMPNHLHGIVWIVGADGVRPGDGVRPNNAEVTGPDQGASLAPLPARDRGFADIVGADIVGADGVRPGGGVHPRDGLRLNNGVVASPDQGACHAPQPDHTLRRLPRSLSSFVAGFKAAVTSRARRELDMTGIWQRNYYDHIIRNEQDFLNIWNYIDTNPQRWQADQLRLPFVKGACDAPQRETGKSV
jgi:REP element-mobilizing transposase RayT